MTDAGSTGEAASPATVAYQRATMLADVGRRDEALAVIEEALGQFPDDLQLRATESWLLLKLGRPGEARDLLAELVAEVPNQGWALLLLSVAEQELENLPAARDAAAKALELEPENAKYHLQVASIAATGTITAADRALAIERVDTALELVPDSPANLLTSAQVHRAIGDSDRARELVALGLAIAPDDQNLHYFRAVLAGDYDPADAKYVGLARVGDQIEAMSEVLGMSPGNIEASQVLFGRVWGQLLRLIDTPLVMIGLVTITLGYFMGTGPALSMLYVGAAFAVVWPAFRLLTTHSVLRRAPKGYLRQMVRGGSDARVRITGSLVAAGAGVVGVGGLLWLREASLVRWLLLLLALGALVGGAATVLWYKRYYDAALEAGLFAPTPLGFRSAQSARKGATGRLWWRMTVLAFALIASGMISGLTRADAGPVLTLAVLAWAVPSVYEVWRVRRIGATLADHDEAPKAVMPSVVGGPVIGFVTVAVLALAVFSIARMPWTPSERDVAGVYEQTTSGESGYDCTGRPGSRLSCIQETYNERMDELVEDLENIEVPEIPDFEVPDIVVPTLPPVPEVVAP